MICNVLKDNLNKMNNTQTLGVFLLIFLLFILFIMQGCSKKDEYNEAITISFSPKQNEFIFSEKFSSLSAFQIKGIPLYEIIKLFPTEDGYLIFSKAYEGQLHIVDKDGNVLFSFAKHGKGPEEFLSITDVALLGNKIYVLDNLKFEIVVFDTNGSLLKTIQTPGPFDNLTVINEDKIVLYRDVVDTYRDYHFHLFDISSGKVLNSYLAIESISELRSFPQINMFSIFDRQILAYKTHSNKVYSLFSKSQPTVKYVFDLGGKEVPSEIFYNEEIDLFEFVSICRGSDFIWSIANYFETKARSYFIYRYMGDLYLNIFDKNESESKSYYQLVDDLFSKSKTVINEGFYPLFFSDGYTYFLYFPDFSDNKIPAETYSFGHCEKFGETNPIIIKGVNF